MKTKCRGIFGYKVGTITCCFIDTAKSMIADLQDGQLTGRRCVGIETKSRNEPAGELHTKGVNP